MMIHNYYKKPVCRFMNSRQACFPAHCLLPLTVVVRWCITFQQSFISGDIFSFLQHVCQVRKGFGQVFCSSSLNKLKKRTPVRYSKIFLVTAFPSHRFVDPSADEVC